MSEAQDKGSGGNPFARLFEGLTGGSGQAMKTWETWVTGQMDKMMRSEQFLGQIGKSLESSMLLRGQMNRLLEESMHNLRMPTLGDVEAVHRRLDEFERRLDAVVTRLEALAPAVAAKEAAAPPPAEAAPEAPARKTPSKPARKPRKAPRKAASSDDAGEAR
ncbi:MAG: hypothetical protein KC620_08745 [Myxococcales bacterium]|nr:hypothetical protein [Myxococcales bacterium]